MNATKEDVENGDAKYKVRLVANGYTQRERVNYHEIFSPVVKHSFIILPALVAQFDLDLV